MLPPDFLNLLVGSVLALLLALLFGFLLRRISRPLAPSKSLWWGAIAPIPVLVGLVSLDGPVTNDERAYLLQAGHFATGELAEPLAPDPALYEQRQVYIDLEGDRRFSKYPPGTAAALAPFVKIGLPWLGPAVACILAMLGLLRWAGQRLKDPYLAVLLCVASPLYVLAAQSYQSELFTLPAAIWAFVGLDRWREGGSARAALSIGALVGWVVLCRPLTGLVLALALAAGLWRGRTNGAGLVRARGILFACLGGIPFLLVTGYYNHALTGDSLLSPYQLYASRFQPGDTFGSGVFLLGLAVQLVRWLPAIGAFGAAFVGMAGLWRDRQRDGGASLLFALGLPTAYAFHWYPGHWAYVGPIYALDSLPLLVVGLLLLVQERPLLLRTALFATAFSIATVTPVAQARMREEAALRCAPQVAAGDARQVVVVPGVGRTARSASGKEIDGMKAFSLTALPSGAGRNALFLRDPGGPDAQERLRAEAERRGFTWSPPK